MNEVVIIGAGPSGAVAGALLKRLGHQVVILEKTEFPRFSIGESLLPQCMEFIAEAGMLEAVQAAGFQPKNGAAFACNGRTGSFDFRDKFSDGPGETFQVQRARFDQILADCAAAHGVEIHYGCEIQALEPGDEGYRLTYTGPEGQKQIDTRFVLDASGFGRVLPRLFDLDRPADFPSRRALFSHICDRIDAPDYDRKKILIVVHPQYPDVWYWLIPFSDGRCSLGVVAEQGFYDELDAGDETALLRAAVAVSPDLQMLLANADYDTPARSIQGYSCKVSSLYGLNFALLGNAGEFLDPVFSSGVTIALKSASLAAPLVSRYLKGEPVDWQSEYADPLNLGVETFRAYVEGWYAGEFQHVVFADNPNPDVRRRISSILAGYAWDTANPLVREPRRRLKAIAELCAP